MRVSVSGKVGIGQQADVLGSLASLLVKHEVPAIDALADTDAAGELGNLTCEQVGNGHRSGNRSDDLITGSGEGQDLLGNGFALCSIESDKGLVARIGNGFVRQALVSGNLEFTGDGATVEFHDFNRDRAFCTVQLESGFDLLRRAGSNDTCERNE